MSYHPFRLKKEHIFAKATQTEKACFEMVPMKTASGLS